MAAAAACRIEHIDEVNSLSPSLSFSIHIYTYTYISD